MPNSKGGSTLMKAFDEAGAELKARKATFREAVLDGLTDDETRVAEILFAHKDDLTDGFLFYGDAGGEPGTGFRETVSAIARLFPHEEGT
jgi:hypothetical protein